MYQWYRLFADEFPLGILLLIAVVLGGAYFFKDDIRGYVKDVTRGTQEIHQPSTPAAKRASNLTGKDSTVYTVSQDDSRLLLI